MAKTKEKKYKQVDSKSNNTTDEASQKSTKAKFAKLMSRKAKGIVIVAVEDENNTDLSIHAPGVTFKTLKQVHLTLTEIILKEIILM